MTNANKTVAERLRDMADSMPKIPWCALPLSVDLNCCDNDGCKKCHEATARMLADMIEAEQAELRAENERLRRDFYEPCARMGFTEHARGIEAMCDALSRVAQGHECRVDVAALGLLCDKLECGGANHRATAEQIRKAMNGVTESKSTPLPEGIVWPRFEDGELVKFGDEYVNANGNASEVRFMCIKAEGFKIGRGQTKNRWQKWGKPVKRPEPEVLDADGVPIKAGDTVYIVDEHPVSGMRTVESVEAGQVWFVENHCWAYPSEVTHRKPDTLKSVRAEIVEAVKADYAVNLLPLFDRYEAAVLRELGGE